MPDGIANKPTIEEGFDHMVDAAAEELAHSVTRGVARRPLALAVCALVWVASLPLQAFTYLCGS